MSGAQQPNLSEIRLLADVDSSIRIELERSCAWKHYAAQEQIIDRQSESRDICFVVRGRVRVVNYSLSGREVTLDDLGEGSHFGELAAIDGQPRSASVMALTDDCLVAMLPPTQFLNLLRQFPDLALRVMRQLSKMVRKSTDRIMDLSTLGANNRVHAELLRQARENMIDKNSALIRPIPVHGDIASRVSTTRETVARVMNELARKNILERQKDTLLIHDVTHLQDLVEEVRGD